MNKGRKNMYDIIVKEKKNSAKIRKNFFLKVQLQEKEGIKVAISQEISNSFGNDMAELADFMTKVILEGLLNGRG